MTPPRPDELAGSARRIADLLPGVVEDYRWLHELAWCAQVNGEGGSGETDKVGSIVLGQKAARVRIEGAATAVDKALKALRLAETLLGEVADIAERRMPLRPEASNERLMPRTVSKAELRGARLAQGRRRRRGEGYGVA